ncbi:DUF971 domain-containing protein [Azohydromonas lata]|uniref:DUF971 domain-containing protein n=1 Tax=Azohydromonas lata TaxID=45677 RepID=A0ABU5IFR8_9BURK|nr:DUF971 domain-containing protein [Azohydromonas lata]MDZ5457966.1 DUF971 domain-containing protein [Azohydromonas lata]
MTIELSPDQLRLRWPDRDTALDAGTLRAACRCAGCRAVTLASTGPEARQRVELTGAEPVGHYALQLRFSDGHERGIYPWSMLWELAQGKQEVTGGYG